MNKKGEMNLGSIIMIFIGIIFGIALLVPIFNTQAEMTTKMISTNETTDLAALNCFTGSAIDESNSACNVTLLNNPSSSTWKPTLCPIDGVSIINGSGTELTDSTDYNVFGSIGVIQMLDTTDTQNDTFGDSVLISYQSCGDGYNVDSGARGIAGIIGLFMAFALFAFILGGIKFDLFDM